MTLLVLISSSMVALAALGPENPESVHHYNILTDQDIMVSKGKKSGTEEPGISNLADLWHQSVNAHGIIVENEQLVLIEDIMTSLYDEDTYNVLKEIIAAWNYAIRLKLLAVNNETMGFYSPEFTDEVMDNISTCYEAEKGQKFSVMGNSPHGCGNTVWDLRVLCSNNYDELVSFYRSMVQASLISPEISPSLSTMSYWVGLVKTGGAWDYKSLDGYRDKIFCCTYGDTTYEDHHVSWVGNYNYGYTGSFLFSLDVLHTGSFIVGKLDEKDKIEDWPAIDEGYYDAP